MACLAIFSSSSTTSPYPVVAGWAAGVATLSLEGDTVSVGDTVWCVGCLSVLYFDTDGVWVASACNILVPTGCRAHKIQPKYESPGLLSNRLAGGVLLRIFMEPEN